MHPIAKRCLTWAIILTGVGTLLLAYGGDLTYWFQNLVGANAEVGVHAFYLITQFVRTFAFPLAAGLVAATIVIQTLAPARDETPEDD